MKRVKQLWSQYNRAVLEAAKRVRTKAIRCFLDGGTHGRAVVVTAPAGAGKTGFIVSAVGKARATIARLRVAVATPTNDQAFSLVWRLATSHPKETVTFVPASTVSLPPMIAQLRNVQQVKASRANKAKIVVGTLSKLGDAFSRGDLNPVDALLIDESYQADSSRYFGVGDLARVHLLVGDCGQLYPFSPIADSDYWRGLPEDPLQTAVGVLLRNHPATPIFQLPLTQRLDARAVAVVRAFYPNLKFEAAVLPGIRELRLLHGIATSRSTKLIDKALNKATQNGWAHVELPEAPVLLADPEIAEVISQMIVRLVARKPSVRCEWQKKWSDLSPGRVAIGVSHNDQKDMLRARLDSLGHSDVVVETANKLQGLEFDIVIAWHPLAGLPEVDGFHLDPGRLCVMLTRHRHACIVVGRAGDRNLLEGIPPVTPAYLGWDPDPVIDGWEAHETIFRALEPYRLIA